jgi:phospholipid/cholesterol/gamma-HCH transport system permease protein
VLSFFTERVKAGVLEVQEYVRLCAAAIRGAMSPPFYRYDIVDQFDAIGLGSLTVVLLTGFFTGAVIALNFGITLDQFGARDAVGRLISATMVKELGPVLTGLMLAGRVGSGIAAELGSMRVGEQIDALEAMGTDPIKKLVKPRVQAGIVMLPILTICTDFIAIVGGQVIAWLTLNQGASTYWSAVWSGIFFSDLFTGLAKPLVFGFIITIVACYLGLRTSGGTEGVGRSTTQAVVVSSVLILASDFFLTKLFIELFGH